MSVPFYQNMKFTYSIESDKQCWERLNTSDFIFGEKKKSEKYPVDEATVKKFEAIWSQKVENIFRNGMREIFGVDFPKEFVCNINSTPYSMDTADGISISASTETPIRTICHESNHYMFRKSNYGQIYFPEKDIEEAKEIFTIVNNIYFQDIIESQDIGWKIFWKERYGFLAKWLKEKNV